VSDIAPASSAEKELGAAFSGLLDYQASARHIIYIETGCQHEGRRPASGNNAIVFHQLLGKDTPSSVSGGGIAFASSRIIVKCGPCNNY
jgi:hypothetical protein